MKFVYPEFLWAFGVLVIPIVIHLFNFRKYKTLYFSSLQFVKVVDLQTKSTQKLKHLLVLITRLLAFIFLVLAFSQPYKPVTNQFSKGGKPVLAVYIDNSFSMSMNGVEGELISEAKEMARKMISKVSLDTRIMLVTNNLSGLEQRLITKIEALERLDKIELSPINRTISEVIEWEKAAIELENSTKQKIGSKQFVILSDFQKSTAKFEELKEDDASYYYPVLINSQDKTNLTIDSVWFSSPVQKLGENHELNVRVHNYSNKDVTNVEVHLEVNSVKRDVFLDIPANNFTQTTFNYSDQKAGFKKGYVSVNDKQFFIDDEYHFSYSVNSSSNILIINGENAVNNIGIVYALDNFYKITQINQNQFTLDAIKGKDLIVINGAKDLQSGIAQNLTEYIEDGGSIALFPGEEIDILSWNNFLKSVNMPLFSSTITEGVKIKNINYDDVFFRAVFEKKPDNLNLPSIAKAYKLNQSATSQSIGLIFLQNGSPLYSKATNGKSIYLFASSLSTNYGTFTSNALFSTILLRTAELSKRKTPLSLVIGTDSKFPIYSKSQSETPIHLKNKSIDFIPRTISTNSLTYVSIGGIEALEKLNAGTYTITDNEPIGSISLNYNRNESNIETLSSDEIISSFSDKGIKNVKFSEITEGQSLTKIDLEKPIEYWRIFIFMTILLIIIEVLLLKFLKK